MPETYPTGEAQPQESADIKLNEILGPSINSIYDKIYDLLEAAKREGITQGKHEQRHQELGVARWIAVGDEYGYWQHPMTTRKAHQLTDKNGEAK